MDTFNYIIEKYKLIPGDNRPVEIPNVGRTDLAKLFHELDFKTGVEVGVAAGEYSLEICENNPQLTGMWGIDPWISYSEYKDYKLRKTFEKLETDARDRLTLYPFYSFIREFSMNAVTTFEDGSLDFCYIDANHTDPYVSQDVFGWAKKVRSGGILSGHDWQRPRGQNFKVKEAVDRYCVENQIPHFFVFGVKNSPPGMVLDSSRSWAIIIP